jgi:hypothetical protein
MTSIGGMVVFLGLWIEKEAEEEEKKERFSDFIGPVKRVKSKSDIGWLILMAGIILEVFLGAWISAWDIKSAADEARNSHLKLPIKSIQAQVDFLTEATNFQLVLGMENLNNGAKFLLMGKDEYGPVTLVGLKCVSIETNLMPKIISGNPGEPQTRPDVIKCSLHFDWFDEPEFIDEGTSHGVGVYTVLDNWVARSNISMATLDSRMTGAEMIFLPLKTDSQIFAYSCSVIINGTIQRRLITPKHANAAFPVGMHFDLSKTNNP